MRPPKKEPEKIRLNLKRCLGNNCKREVNRSEGDYFCPSCRPKLERSRYSRLELEVTPIENIQIETE